MERYLVHAEGDYYGKPFRLRSWQKELVWRAYELNPDGTRRYNRVVLGLPKGNGKTELGAALSCAELAGPIICQRFEKDQPIGMRRVSPDIPVGAASFEQADILFGAARAMIKAGQLADYFDVYDTEILPKDGPGRMYRVAAIAGTNDGRRPTFFVADEVHEWTGNKERVYLILSNGRAKRADSWELAISTAGWDSTSLLGRMYEHGKRVLAKEEDDPALLFTWYEPKKKDFDLGNRKALEKAVRDANPAVGDFLPLDNVLARAGEIPEFEFRRYHTNQWVSAPERWLPYGAWDACASDRTVPDGSEIFIGFDGSFSGDSTAIVGCTKDAHLFVIGHWEKPSTAGDDWYVNPLDVESAIQAACERWKVTRIGCDPHRWQRSLAKLEEAGLPVIKWPSHSAPIMVAGTQQFQEGVLNHALSHDGDERLARHVGNCVVKIDSRGPRITKDHKDSVRRIDLAVAAVIAHDLLVRDTSKVSIYETRDPIVIEV